MKRRMNNVNFNLKDAKSLKDTHIVIIFRYNGYRMKYYTNLKVHPEDWNAKRQRAKEGGQKDLIELNKRLAFIESTVKGIYLEYLNEDKHLSPETFKVELDKTLNPEREDEDSFFSYFDRFVNEAKTPNTKKTRQTVKNLLKSYSQTLPAKRLDYEDIDMKFYDNFHKWIKLHGYAESYFGKTIQITKQVLRKAHSRKLYKTTDPIYKDPDFGAKSESSIKPYLDMNELNKIYNLSLPKGKLDEVRDYFILSCLMGLRYSDMVTLKKDDFKLIEDSETHEKGYFLELNTKKTGEEISVPVHPTAIEILEKNSWQLPRPLSGQRFNVYIREICKRAGINEMIWAAKRIGNDKDGYKRIEKDWPKYELVSSHTARRSFVSNAREWGVAADLIMAMVGHRSASMFLLYNKQTVRKKAMQAAQNKFFQKPLLRKVVND